MDAIDELLYTPTSFVCDKCGLRPEGIMLNLATQNVMVMDEVVLRKTICSIKGGCEYGTKEKGEEESSQKEPWRGWTSLRLVSSEIRQEGSRGFVLGF